ncbi:GFA family protein [Shewanella sp. 202IG2-18]|uniref:GFA family protein n=1 Tax=Parashewanella hymeniacidonis TaxID=2807618 RepID=UPI00195FBB6A|nr:GFA family protein [Parashewanella hymeniacidonis]MBM7071389.1 GFA family protein [Parashewanella hymeniacidonis]
MEQLNAKGQCLCGSIQITATKISTNIGACHCSSCRQWGGGPLLAVDCGNAVQFSNQKSISIYDSSSWAERGFCSQCGSHLFYRLKHNQQHIMPVGLFEDSKLFNFDHQIFIDEQPEYYCFSNQTHNMTGAEVFAQFAPQD